MLIMVHPKFIYNTFGSKAVMGDIYLSFKNTYDKTIKYIYFSIVVVNELCEPIVLRNQVRKLEFTGPLKSGEFATSTGLVQYYSDVIHMSPKILIPVIVKIEIEFMDNTKETISEREIKYDDSILPKPKEGCYIATCVYGSYDCPEVWTLRRFRDFFLKKKKWGKKFIKIYYKISPNLVEIFGKSKLLKKITKIILNIFVFCLQKKGYQNSEYKD